MNDVDGAERDFRGLYSATYGDVLRFVQRRCPPESAEDVVAEVFLVAWRCYADLPPRDEQRRAWLYATARKVLSNIRRGEQRRDALHLRIADAHPGGTVTPEDLAARLDLAAAWRRLTVEQQEVLSLHLWDDLGDRARADLDNILTQPRENRDDPERPATPTTISPGGAGDQRRRGAVGDPARLRDLAARPHSCRRGRH
ncbi:MAG: sigma factor [Mobilicoccus sp.]|nr:sigma factor [Mobilicoccus sp.]